MRLPFFFKSISSWGDYPPTHPPTHPSNQPTKYSPNPPTHPPTTGNKACISYGLALVGLAFLFIGPFPFPFPPPPLTLVWSLLLLSLSLIGLGSALIVVPAVPLMLDRKETTHPLLDLKDPISSLYTLAWSVGDAAGPFLGGVLTQLLPQTDEVVCLGRKEEREEREVKKGRELEVDFSCFLSRAPHFAFPPLPHSPASNDSLFVCFYTIARAV